MSDSVALIKENPLLPAEDYNALRKQGFRSVERLGSDVWTEYNNSDPGITILEAVCYAITDLAYRTDFEMKDLLTPAQMTEDTWKNIFYTAREILHNNPLTISDYRKLIIDVKGVRNAWLEPSKDYEVPIWVDYNYYEKREDADCGCENKETKNCYGKLGLQPMDPAVVEQRNNDRIVAIDKIIAENLIDSGKKEGELVVLKSKLERERDSTDLLSRNSLQYQIDKLIHEIKKLKRKNKELEEEKTILTNQLFTPSKIVELEGLYNVIVEYEEDILEDGQRDEVRQNVINRLNSKRNLCEDFLSVNAVEYEDFGIGASVAIEEYADPDAILSQMYFAIFKYFTPSVQFYTIPQMMAKGYQVDEIFEGPALRHGFIDTKELERTDMFRDIRLSDIINDFVTEKNISEKIKNEITGIKGIKAITYLHLPFKDPSAPVSEDNYFTQWIKNLTDERRLARIRPSMSSVIFCKEHEVITFNTGSGNDRRPDRMLKMFNDLKKQERKYKLEKVGNEFNDFNVPAGENMELQDYYPVTYSLPMHYGVSERAGLPLDASETRKVQALQLKGYMLFFEQLLSGYLVQLDHLRDIFSFDDEQEKTYFVKALDKEMSDIQSLIIDHADRGPGSFDDILKDFTTVLHNLVEPPSVFYKRRNYFLDHMLARFSEDLNEYELISRWLTPTHVEKRLIRDKANILKDGNYKKISTERAKAYNYSLQKVWNTDNVSGAEIRIGRLLGFNNVSRRSLSPEFIITEPVMVTEDRAMPPSQKKNKKGQGLYVIKFLDPEDHKRIVLTSAEVPDGCCIEELITEILEHADDHRYIKFHDEIKQKSRVSADITGSYSFEVWNDDPENPVAIAKSERFDTKDERNEAYHSLKKMMEIINNDEGLHLIEHLLLRPKFDVVYDVVHNEVNEKVAVSFPDICLDICDIGRGLDKKIQPPGFRKRITRIPAYQCYDNMPWVLEYLRLNTKPDPPKFESLLFKQTFKNNDELLFLTFRRYDLLAKRVKELAEYGSERDNYGITDNKDELDDPTDVTRIKYSFTIYDEDRVQLAQTPYVFNQRRKPTDPPVENDIEEVIKDLMDYFEFELDLYCDPDPCDNNEDPFSFRCTIVLPCWPKRLRNPTFRNLVEKTIHSELPAHIHPAIKWVGMAEMKRFEKIYFDWLSEMAQTEMPAYEFVNPLVDILNTLVPCGCCHDECHDTHSENKNSPN